jgi:hypothetical protein
MTASRDPATRIAAFFEANQPDLPDRAFDAIRHDIHRTRQLVAIGPWREPLSVRGAGFVAAAAAVLAVGIVLFNLRPVLGPGGVPSPGPTASVAPSPAVSSSPAASPSGPAVFTSPFYGYTVTIPAGWSVEPAFLRWDGITQPGPDVETDKFVGPEKLDAWAFAGPFSGNLAAFVADRIVANARDHSDTCPVEQPEINEQLQIGEQAWVLLGWNCGALINNALTVRGGVAYEFVLRDFGVKAANDPADLALFLSILDSVELPN